MTPIDFNLARFEEKVLGESYLFKWASLVHWF